MPKIMEMYAFIVEDSGPDDEGIIAMPDKDNTWLPLVGADMERVESLKPIAARIGSRVKKKVHLIHFTQREDLGIINEENTAPGTNSG